MTMLFAEKFKLVDAILSKNGTYIDLKTLGDYKEQYHYRNKSVYTFNLDNFKLDQGSFDIVDLDHSKIIQYINLVTNRDLISFNRNYGIKDIFIKHNYCKEFQLSMCLYVKDGLRDYRSKIVSYMFDLVKKLIVDLDINITCCYYHIYDKHVALKDREMFLLFGNRRLEERLVLANDSSNAIIKVWIRPHSFSRVNYGNSQLVYQQVHQFSRLEENLILFGRDVYAPLKMLFSGEGVKTISAFTHCPITYGDIEGDMEKGLELSQVTQLIKKKEYPETIAGYFRAKAQKFAVILTASQQGLGQIMCQMLLDFRDQISKILYISCNRDRLEGDLSILTTRYQLEKAYVSNEFSLTQYNNTILELC